MYSQSGTIYFYSEFINKLIHAGRGDGTKAFFRFAVEIDRADFIRFANKFIEEYYATVPPEFAIIHPMKFCFGTISEDDLLMMSPKISSTEINKYPGLNGGILYIEKRKGEKEDDRILDASIFRQACYIKRERLKYLMTVAGSAVAVAALAISLIFGK